MVDGGGARRYRPRRRTSSQSATNAVQASQRTMKRFAPAAIGRDSSSEGFQRSWTTPRKCKPRPIAPDDLDESRPPIAIAASIADRSVPLPPRISKRRRAPASGAARGQRRSAGRCRSCKPGFWRWCWSTQFLLAGATTSCACCRKPPPFYALLGMPVNLRGLTFDGVVTSTEQHEGVPILVVEGNVVNTARKSRRRAAAQIHRAQRGAAGDLFLDRGSARARHCRRARALAFRTRLASPPPDAA